MKKVANVSSVCLNSSKSLLWKHGGHPILPSSGDLYKKQCTFSDLCEMVWPRKNKFIKLGMYSGALRRKEIMIRATCTRHGCQT